MGEKLLAQRALSLLRDTFGQSSREAGVTLEWAREQRDWLWSGRDWCGVEGEPLDWESLRSRPRSTLPTRRRTCSSGSPLSRASSS
jgi:hypothetical protein